MDTKFTEQVQPLVARLEAMAHFSGGPVEFDKNATLALKRVLAGQAEHLDRQAELIELYEALARLDEQRKAIRRKMLIDFSWFAGFMAIIAVANTMFG